MDNKTLALSYMIVAVSVFLTSLTIAIYRKEKSYKIFSCSFVASAIGVLLIAGEGKIHLWLDFLSGGKSRDRTPVNDGYKIFHYTLAEKYNGSR